MARWPQLPPEVAVAVRGPAGLHTAGFEAAAPVFSVTKMFVATAVLRLVEQGRLRLNEQACRWVPSVPPDVTLRDLLRHTGGLPDYATDPRYLAAVRARPARPWHLDELLDLGLLSQARPPGRFHYSNLGYWLLGAVIEAVTGPGLDQQLASLVFRPAGMTATYYPHPGAGLTVDGYDTRWAGPAGACWASATDIVRFLALLRGGRLLSADSLAAMQAVLSVPAGRPWQDPGYGLGLMVDNGHHVAGHAGEGPGFAAAGFTKVTTGRSVAVIAPQATGVDPVQAALDLLGSEDR